MKLDNSDIDGTFGLIIISGQTKIQHLRSYTREDRDSWKTAIEAASYFTTRARLESLKNHIAKRREAETPVSPSLGGERSLRDPNQSALLSCRFSCEIPSDRRGQPLSVRSVSETFFSFSSLFWQVGRTGSQPGGGAVAADRLDRVQQYPGAGAVSPPSSNGCLCMFVGNIRGPVCVVCQFLFSSWGS